MLKCFLLSSQVCFSFTYAHLQSAPYWLNHQLAHLVPLLPAVSMAQPNIRLQLAAAAECQAVQSFCQSNRYPSMEECTGILASNVRLLSEYGDLTHELMAEIYNSGFQDKELIATSGRVIWACGGAEALSGAYYAVNRIMAHLATQAEPSAIKEIRVKDASGATIHVFSQADVVVNANSIWLQPAWEDLMM